MKKLHVLILPDFDSFRVSMGFDEFDDDSTEAKLYQQGYNGRHMDISDNDIFEIENGFIGRINSEGNYYLLTAEEDLECKEDYQIKKDLREGKYRFSAKDCVLYKLDDEDDESEDGIIHDSFDESEDMINDEDLIWNLITDSAKSRFDYDSFSENMGDDSASDLLFQIIVALAIGESKVLTAAKLNAQIMGMDFIMENDSFVHFIEEREKDLGMEILALKIARTNLDNGADPLAVYLQTEDFISKVRE